MLLGLLERFNYPSLAALRSESTEILELLHAESYGYKRDEKERMERLEAEIAELRNKQ